MEAEHARQFHGPRNTEDEDEDRANAREEKREGRTLPYVVEAQLCQQRIPDLPPELCDSPFPLLEPPGL